jgi:electron transport complex protein RnfG
VAGTLRVEWRAVLRVGLAAAIVAALVTGAGLALQERIARNEAARVMQVLGPLLRGTSFDNRPDRDRILVSSADLPGSGVTPLPVYRARLRGEPVAAILTTIAPAGYVGPIRLLVAIGADGTILAVHAQAHRETPGLGDRIDGDKSDWIGNFTGRALDRPPVEDWGVRGDGGAFDQLTGATITSRAVVHAVRDALRYFEAHREEVFNRPSQ